MAGLPSGPLAGSPSGSGEAAAAALRAMLLRQGLRWRGTGLELWRVLRRRQPRLTETLFFVHIPKTAGTSFRNMLFRVFPQRAILPSWAMLGANAGHYPPLAALPELIARHPAPIRLLAGHYPYAAGDWLSGPVARCVFLREPHEQLLSTIRHLQQRQGLLRDAPLAEIIRERRGMLANPQTRYLCDTRMGEQMHFHRPRRLGPEQLASAKAQLDACAFVGLSEDFAGSVRLAEQRLGCRLGTLVKTNTTARPRGPIPAEVREQLAPLIALDCELYRHALQRLERDLAGLEQPG